MWPPVRTLEVAVRGGQARLERLVDEQPPHLLERNVADELLDVDAAVAELAAVAVGLGDLGLERDDAGEARAELVSCVNLLQLDLQAGAALPRRSEHERRGGEVLDGDADRLVQRDLARARCGPRRVPATSSPSST